MFAFTSKDVDAKVVGPALVVSFTGDQPKVWRADMSGLATATLELRDAGGKAGDLVACTAGHDIKLIMIVLTIAHLDHTPENCDDDNLRAWCQRHHLGYDALHHKQTAYASRKARANTQELPW